MALGRGLESLIPPKTLSKITKETLKKEGEEIFYVSPDFIEPNPHQPRKIFSYRDLEELINSIRTYGIIQPLIVTKLKENKYQLIAGERRLRAAKILKLKTVPVIIRTLKEAEKLEISLIENIQRKDLNPIEKARAYQRLISEFNLTQEKLAERLGKNRASVANTLRLLTLPEEIQKALEEEKITEGHAKALLSLKDRQKQKNFLSRIIGLGLSVRETEKIITHRKTKKYSFDSLLNEKERLLSEILRTKVRIKKKVKGGKIIIDYYSDEELENLIKKFKKI